MVLDSRVSEPLSGHLRNWDVGRSWTVLEARVAGPRSNIFTVSFDFPETSSTHWIPASVLTHLSLPQNSPVRWPPDSQRSRHTAIELRDSIPGAPGHFARTAED